MVRSPFGPKITAPRSTRRRPFLQPHLLEVNETSTKMLQCGCGSLKVQFTAPHAPYINVWLLFAVTLGSFKKTRYQHAVGNCTYICFNPNYKSLFVVMYSSCAQIKIKSKLLGAVKITINDQGCQHVTGRFESIRMFLSKQTGWPTFVQSRPSVNIVEWFKKQLSHNLPTLRKGENKWPAQVLQNCPTRYNRYSDSESRAMVTHATAQPILWFRSLSISLPHSGVVLPSCPHSQPTPHLKKRTVRCNSTHRIAL